MNLHNRLDLLAAAFATATALIGQTAPVPANPKAGAKDNAIKLSPFEVRNEKDQGYVATSTLAGTRLNTPLRDTPVAISVFTEEFLKQIDAVTVVDVLKFAMGVEPSYDSTGNVRSGSDVVVKIRGLGRSTMARN